jgi:hypothetical protein
MATTSAKAAYSAAHAMGEIKRMALDSFIMFDRLYFEKRNNIMAPILSWCYQDENDDRNILILTHRSYVTKIHMPEGLSGVFDINVQLSRS